LEISKAGNGIWELPLGNQSKAVPLFVFPERPLRNNLVWLFGFAFLAFGAYFSYTTPDLGLADSIWSGFLSLACVYFAVHPWFYPIREARFYEDHAELTGRREGAVLLYQDITSMKKVRAISFRDPWTQIHITTKDQEKPLRIFGNPMNKQLKMSLYDWLLQRTQGQF
jgi:hypothetical protein